MSDIRSLSKPKEIKSLPLSDKNSPVQSDQGTEQLKKLLSAPSSFRGFNGFSSETSKMSRTFYSADKNNIFKSLNSDSNDKRDCRRIKNAEALPRSHQKSVRSKIRIMSPKITAEEKEIIKKQREFVKLLNIAMKNQQKQVELQTDRSNTNKSVLPVKLYRLELTENRD